MLVVLGGVLGSGTKVLAHVLERRFGLHYYDIHRKKMRSPRSNEKGFNPVIQPKTDEEYVRVYKSACEELSVLSRMHTNIVVEDLFFRRVPREYFLSEARKYFDRVVFVWVESDEKSAEELLVRLHEVGRIESVEFGLQRRAKGKELLEPPPASVPRFSYSTSDERPGAALWELIQRHAA